MKKINIIAPVYNEAEVIANFHSELFKVIDLLQNRYQFEVVYVLDKSTDDSLTILKKICENAKHTRLIALSKRFGHQMSLVAGMDKCDGDAVIMMDSDLEHPPEVILHLLGEFEKGYDIVNTKRTYGGETSFLKKFLSGLFYRMVSAISYVKINEGFADFRLISNKVLKVFQGHIREQNQFLRFLFPWVGFDQVSVEFVSDKRKAGKSKYNYWRLINFAIIGAISFSKTPLRISVIAGLILSVLSIIYGIYSLLQYIFGSTIPQGWTSLIILISFIGGFQLIALGIIGEYIGSIFDEAKKRPLYIIEEEYRSSQ